MADTETFQHYQVLKHPDGSLWELGRGAMGVTYKAFDTSLRCNVALKVINAAYLDSDMARQRFLREARAAAGLSHPNVASVFHLGEEGGNYFYAMEFIDGETLEAFVRRQGPLPPVVALKIALQVSRALRAASREGLVHRDIKPANLMLLREDDEDEESDEGEQHVKVIDFGLAKVSRKDGSEASATITVAGFVGTPHFASPEQLEEKDLDVRSDIYSLGVTLWYMLAGRPPFSGSMVQIMSQHLTRLPAFDQLHGIPPEVVRLLGHMLEKDPAKRPQTATELRREIETTIRSLHAGRAEISTAANGGAPEVAPTSTPLESSFPTRAAEGNSVSHELETGTVLANRYRLLQTVARGTHGTLFQALELDHGQPVALRILPPGLLATPEAFLSAGVAVSLARSAPHPSLVTIYSLERSGALEFLTCEWINGFTLVDLLRHRGALPLDEVLRCLEPLAQAADHVRQSGLPDLDFSPSQVLLAFEATLDLPARSALLNVPLAGWPTFRPKVYPLSIAPDASQPATTWAGLQTMVPASVAPPGALRQIALLAYELLGGIPSNQQPHQARPPLPALSERGNLVLRQALSVDGTPSFQHASDWVAALRESAVGDRTDASATRARAVPAASAASVLPTAFPSGSPLSAVPVQPALVSPNVIPTKSRGPVLTILLLLVGLIILGVIGGASYAAWKIFALAETHTHPARNTAHNNPATPTPDLTTPTPPPTPEPRTPSPTPVPPVNRVPRPTELLTQADILARDGDDAGALSLYAKVAEDYPQADPGLSRLDSFIGKFRVRLPTPEAEQRRAQPLRAPMEQAARLGSDAAMLFLGDHLLTSEPSTAAEWYRQAAAKGQPEAMLALGDMYYRGEGVPLEPAQAVKWYELASDKGYPKAKVYLAECYELGKAGLPRNYDKSFRLLNEALALDPNNAPATEKLAEQYERGRGTVPDANHAFSLMKRAVDLGNTQAIGNLGAYYMKGLGQKADPKMAVSLFRQGMEKKSPQCLFFYAQCLEKGLGGLTANPAEAVGYYRAAAERNFPPAREWCNQHRVNFTPADHSTP